MKRILDWIANSGLLIAVAGVGILHAHVHAVAYPLMAVGVGLMLAQMWRIVFPKKATPNDQS